MLCMENVFDLVNAFYEQDPSWNEVLQQKDAEGYIRSRMWNGAENDELRTAWDDISFFTLYLGNVDAYIGDFTGEDIIDCIAWCARNIAGFCADYETVVVFINDLTEFYQYMYKKKLVPSVEPPLDAMMILTESEADGQFAIFDEDGKFQPGYEDYAQISAPDLPAKIFFNIGNLVDKTLERLSAYFSHKRFNRDLARARYMFGDFIESLTQLDDKYSTEFNKSFWEYFLLDYHLLDSNKTPLQVYYDAVKAGKIKIKDRNVVDVLKELLKSQLVLFSVEAPGELGTVICRDFVTGEEYTLLMDVSALDNNSKDALFLGHIFYNKSIILNVVRGHLVKPSSKKVLYDILIRAKAWVAKRYNGELSWQDFIKEYPVFFRHTVLVYSGLVRLDRFNFHSELREYQSHPLLDDKVSRNLQKLMGMYLFSSHDILLAQTLWSDYKHLSGEKAALPEVWTAAVLYAFIKVNPIYTYDINKISEICEFVPASAIEAAYEKIHQCLKIEKHDPRYINEEGLLMMALM